MGVFWKLFKFPRAKWKCFIFRKLDILPNILHLLLFVLVIELACGEYGYDKIPILILGSENGKSTQWFENADTLVTADNLRGISITS